MLKTCHFNKGITVTTVIVKAVEAVYLTFPPPSNFSVLQVYLNRSMANQTLADLQKVNESVILRLHLMEEQKKE